MTRPLALRSPFAVALVLALTLGGCDAFGSKQDDTTDEIFQEGQTDPTFVDDVGYVPLSPFYTQTTTGTFDAPVDVAVGYDELLYVADRAGVHVLDLAGRPRFLLSEVAFEANPGPDGTPGTADDIAVPTQPLRDITAITQDRQFDLYVAARRDTTVAGADCPSPGGPEQCDLAVVYRIRGLTTGAPRVVDILWHPFDDGSRASGQVNFPDVYSTGASDEDAVFSGVATLADNSLYVVRRGPVNNTASGRPSQSFSPFNAFLQFTNTGQYVQYIRALSPDRASLLSVFYPSDVLTFLGPPQRADIPFSPDFMIAQAPPPGEPTPDYGVVSVRVVETTDGIDYQVDSPRLAVAGDPEAGDGALFDAGKFTAPSSLAFAPDETGYLFVLDAGTDSLYVFNQNGVEGVAPPPGSGSTRPARVSFGGTGGAPLQFRSPQGVAYFERVVYVADTGNNRVSRFRLNTDFE